MSDKKAVAPKPNVFQRVAQNIRTVVKETIGELRKVSWPTRQEAVSLTRVVLLVILVMSIFLGILDVIYSQIFRFILGA